MSLERNIYIHFINKESCQFEENKNQYYINQNKNNLITKTQ